MWTGLVWLRIGTGGELLWTRYWTFGFHEMLGNYYVQVSAPAKRCLFTPPGLEPSGNVAPYVERYRTELTFRLKVRMTLALPLSLCTTICRENACKTGLYHLATEWHCKLFQAAVVNNLMNLHLLTNECTICIQSGCMKMACAHARSHFNLLQSPYFSAIHRFGIVMYSI
jgi:hypothetical protein